MGFGFKQFIAGVRIVPVTSTGVSLKGDLEVLDASGKLNYFNGATASPVLTETHSATISNKILDASNTFLGSISTSFPDGTVSLPGIPFASQLSTGIYKPAPSSLAIATNGILALTLDSSQNTLPAQQILSIAGTVSLPSRAYVTSPSTGEYLPAVNTLGFVTNGIERARIDSAGSLRVGTTANILGAGPEQLSVLNTITVNPAGTARGISARMFADVNSAVSQQLVGIRGETYRRSNTSVTDTSALLAGTSGGVTIDLPAPSTFAAPLVAGLIASGISNVNGSTLNITEASGLAVLANSSAMTGTKYGIALGAQSGATRNVGIGDSIPSAGTSWMLYLASTNPSFHGGAVRIGTNAVDVAGATEKLTVLLNQLSTVGAASYGASIDNLTQGNTANTFRQTGILARTNRFITSNTSESAPLLALEVQPAIGATPAATYTNTNIVAGVLVNPVLPYGSATLALTYYAGMFFDTDSTSTGGKKSYVHFQPLSSGSAHAYITDNTSFTGNNFISQSNAAEYSTFVGPIRIDHQSTVGESGYIRLQEKDAAPTNPTAGVECKFFFGNDKFIIQYNDAGTTRYKYLDMAGTGVTWVHTTVSPV